MASADFAEGRFHRSQSLFQRLSDLADFEAKPAEVLEDVERQPIDILEPDDTRKRERFIPVTRFALLDRLTKPFLWPAGQAADARRFFRYLDYWRQQQYFALLLDLEQTYEAFSPDSDLLMTRSFSDDERDTLKHRVFEGVESLLKRANYERIDPSNVELILTRDSHYGLDLFVDMNEFDRISIFYRGASNRKYERRRIRKFLRKEEFDVPIFQRLFLMFKLKPVEMCIEEAMRDMKLSREAAEKYVAKARAHFPKSMNEKNIYLKLFKNIPRTDVEMIFPNTKVRFRPMDKLRLGVTAGGGLGMGAAGAAGKVALLMSNPIAAIGALAGLGGIAARQAMGFLNQKQRYMVIMAQNLYFHTMADNRGVILKIAARGAEEDVKEEMLLYSVLAKEKSTRADLPSIDLAIENYLTRTFGVKIDFEIDDALDRLIRDGIVVEKPDGSFVTLPPAEAAKHIDAKWDLFLDHLPDPVSTEGYEFEGRPA
ncbi:TMEM143 family protein [Hyphomicrobium sp. 99]|uniref:TMEM143 family protein n=1 Tax=Hyphomicrobium sp. 99 TaxID=1163419 RepID=UPI0005F79DA9|nr:TMEM143 family protein [Hyphomicrobium sp. 99]